MKYPLTPGADRSVRRAAKLAESAPNNAIAAIHMLDALLLEEVVATKILEAFGVSFEVAQQFHNQVDDQPVGDEYINELLDCAWSAFHLEGNKPELESEHLLYGLLKADSSVSKLLANMGLNVDTGFEFLKTGNANAAPIEVDFSLQTTTSETATANPADNQPRVEHDSLHKTDPVKLTANVSNVDVMRIVDAAANRLREGLRVLDDYSRFILNDTSLTETIKRLRHTAVTSFMTLDQTALRNARNTPGDVGTAIHTPNELHRASLSDVVIANLKRAQESARSLEEFGKLINQQFALDMKQLRYELYTLESSIPIHVDSQSPATSNITLPSQSNQTKIGSRKSQLADCQLYVLISEAGCTADWKTVVESAIAGGADIIQLREKQLSDRELLNRARWVRQATKNTNTLFIMNDRPDIAALADADGVHVGQDESTVADARSIIGPDKLIGVSTHSVEQATTAVDDSADYIGVGPVFPSTTKSFQSFVGLNLVQEIAAAKLAIPFFAIGGITQDNLQSVIDAGGQRVAVSSAVCNAPSADDACRSLNDLL